MSLEMRIPAVGESITEVTIATWLKKDGDYVELDEIIVELETDKATQEFPAEASGKLTIKAEEGETVGIGDLIAVIDTDAVQSNGVPEAEEKADEPATSTATQGEPQKTGEVVEMVVPALGESITEVTIGAWLKEEGDYVELDEAVAEVETDKATQEFPAEASGILHIVAEEGATLSVGEVVCKIEITEGAPSVETQPGQNQTEKTGSTETEKETYATGHASPAAAKILAEKGISPSDVNGTGKDGRITKDDAEKAQKARQSAASAPKEDKETTQTSSKASMPNEGERSAERKKMTNLRKTISRRLVAVKNETAMLTTFNEVNMKPIMDIRKKYKEPFKEKHGVGLGFMSFFTKAVCVALKEWPAVNGMIDGEELVYHNYCDISIAVSTPKGLVTPVVRSAEHLSFQQIESEIINLATKARDGKLSIEEMTGGTFTITNGGVFGSMLSTPIINPPQSAILGMHNIVERPVVENGDMVVRPIMYVALSYDHRIIDGRESVSFLVRVKQLLEDPSRLLLEV
jgi:2-oxoglutarate dehydrogenase E2 component (dihydrolipoamide succinyltransferase)